VSDDKKLIERLRSAAWGGLVDVPICDEAADTIARLEAERDAARMAFYESSAWKYDQGTLTLQLMVNREEVAQVGMVPAHLAAALGGAFMSAVRAAANNQENQQVAGVCGPSEQQSERDAARREAMEECARMAAQVASDCESWEEGGDFGSSGAYAVEAAIRAAMQGK
jgi:hypothetical protein